MKRHWVLVGFAGLIVSSVFADSTWVLENSVLAYHADHPFHKTTGKSTSAKGKGVCTSNGCDFLVAAPVKSFDSGDANRDLHMLQAVNGGKYPMVSVRTQLKSEPTTAGFKADLSVDFGGKQVVYKDVTFEVTNASAHQFTAKGKIPLLLTNHNVDRPSLLGVSIKDNAPVDVEVIWKKQN